jgi:hypothetical protein
MAKVRDKITDFYGKIIGYIETDTVTNDKTATNFYGKILGYYRANQNATTNFYGKIIGKGDLTSALIYQEASKK